MKKKVLITFIVIACVLLGITGIYFSMVGYYTERFCYGTWINGVYCTGKTVQEVNDELVYLVERNKISIIDRNQVQYDIFYDEIGHEIDYTSALKDIKSGQNRWEWPLFYMSEKIYTIKPDVTFSEDLLSSVLYKKDFMNYEVYSEDNTAEIVLEEDGYKLYDHTINQIVPEKVYLAVSQALYKYESTVCLSEKNECYVSMPVTSEVNGVYRLWDEINAFQSFELTYLLGEDKEYVTAAQVSKWIATDEKNGSFLRDENGDLFLDETKVMDYVVSLGEKYDTVNKPREFMATRGEVISIETSVYGNDIDEEKECALLMEDFMEGRSGTEREPVYAQKAWFQGMNDVGGTYIEVDMTQQMLYYYVDYEIALETPVVTGNMRRGWDTPAVVCSIYGKARNRTLRGANYATFVYYWMPVYGNIGLHDATWRRKFGEDIYMTDGSHGCINMPKDKAAELYGMVEIGTPVFLFY